MWEATVCAHCILHFGSVRMLAMFDQVHRKVVTRQAAMLSLETTFQTRNILEHLFQATAYLLLSDRFGFELNTKINLEVTS